MFGKWKPQIREPLPMTIRDVHLCWMTESPVEDAVHEVLFVQHAFDNPILYHDAEHNLRFHSLPSQTAEEFTELVDLFLAAVSRRIDASSVVFAIPDRANYVRFTPPRGCVMHTAEQLLPAIRRTGCDKFFEQRLIRHPGMPVEKHAAMVRRFQAELAAFNSQHRREVQQPKMYTHVKLNPAFPEPVEA